MEKVCVTGASGYIATHIVQQLLNKGYEVHACLRSNKDFMKKEILAPEGKGELKIFTGCDLLKEGSFDEAMAGCEYCLHTASPFGIADEKDPQAAFVDPALKGTENVLNSCTKSGTVKRVVLTSSIAAVTGEPVAGKTFTEEDWNTTSSLKYGAYSYSKRLAEEKGWEMSKAQDQWSFVTINPVFVMGPTLSGRANEGSISFVKKNLLSGSTLFAPELIFGVVDVRDVAKAHLLAMDNGEGRYICHNKRLSMKEMGALCRQTSLKSKARLAPRFSLPKGVFYTVAPMFGVSRQFVSKEVGVKCTYSNEKIKNELGLVFTDEKDTFNDMLVSLQKFKLI